MATGWSLEEIEGLEDLSQTVSMLSDVSPIPIKNSPRQHVAMCTKVLNFVVADESRAEEDIDLDRKSVSQYGSSNGAPSSSDQSMVLEAQRILAEELIGEAEAEARVRKFKVDAARIAVAQAAHQASSNASHRSRTRIEIMPIAPLSPVNRRPFQIVNVVTTPLAPVVKDVSFISGLTGDGRGLSEDLSSLLRHELDEPMHEPDHNHEAHRATEQALNEVIVLEGLTQQTLEQNAQLRQKEHIIRT